ncbi:hypothetical protein [Orenia metallireducens]|uniref:hypothetical protein n=1 Tax=Orenia metallireducens TaxID=1413210 RepID=UPI001C0EE5CF|nr:hypothetical protein [Orenia metallireducens]
MNENIGAPTIAKILESSDKNRVYLWVKHYNEKGKSAFNEEIRGKFRGKRKGRPKTKFNSLEEEIKYLKRNLEFSL